MILYVYNYIYMWPDKNRPLLWEHCEKGQLLKHLNKLFVYIQLPWVVV